MKTDMKKYYVMMSLVALVTMAMTSCLQVKLGENGWSSGNYRNDTPSQVNQLNQATTMNAFDELISSGPFDVIYEQGENYSVRVDGTAEQLEKITIYVENGKLHFDQRRDEKSRTFDNMKVYVTSPGIKNIKISGAGDLSIPHALNLNDLDIRVSGAGDITIAELNCKDLSTSVSGAGDITLRKVNAHNISNQVSGAGDITISGLTCNQAKNKVSGAGDITINCTDVGEVDSSISGAGDITLRGEVGTHKESISGSGDVHVSGLNK